MTNCYLTNEDPPERGQRALFWNGGLWEIGTWTGWTFDNPKASYNNVQYWMPLPPRPIVD